MQRVASALGICVLVSALSSLGKEDVSAQSCNYFAGTAVGGQDVNVDTCSISRASYQSVDFIYIFGK